MVKRWLMSGSMLAAALLLAAGFVVSPGTIAAQDMGASPAAGMEGHPAHIHAGTCDTLGEVVFPLEDVTSVESLGELADEGAVMGSPEADMSSDDMDEMDSTPTGDLETDEVVVARSLSVVEASLDDILAAEHAINVHESMENIQNYIACGDITGEATDGTLEIELNELNDSGYEGRATLTDNGDGTTMVLVQLTPVGDGMDAEMDDDMATPTS